MSTSSTFLTGSFLAILFACSILSCTNTQELSNTAVATSKNKKNTRDVTLLYGPNIRQKEMYANIQGNVPRLKAMLSGQFIQYVKVDTLGTYGPWLVNEGKDSVLIYQLPVGNPDKDGHWIYNCQYLTSLPNDPIISSFSKITAIDRDSIVLVDYDAPEGFTATVQDIIARPEKVFKEFDFKKLTPAVPLYRVDYVRQTPLHYLGICKNIGTQNGRPAEVGRISYSYHDITPELYSYGIANMQSDSRSWKKAEQVRFFKKAMVKL